MLSILFGKKLKYYYNMQVFWYFILWQIKSKWMVLVRVYNRIPIRNSQFLKSLSAEKIWFLSPANIDSEIQKGISHSWKEKKKIAGGGKDFFASTPSCGQIWKCSVLGSSECPDCCEELIKDWTQAIWNYSF